MVQPPAGRRPLRTLAGDWMFARPAPTPRRPRSLRAGRAAILLGVAAFAGLPSTSPASPGGSERPASSADEKRPARPASLLEGVLGRLVGRSGEPLADVLIAAAGIDGSSRPVPELSVRTDRDGRFEWRLGPGRYRLDAVADGRVVASANVVVVRGRATALTLTVGRAD